MNGLVHIYCGDGKGKTTAAMGLAVRAAGRGRKVVLTQFMKSGNSSELKLMKELPGIYYIPCEESFGFYWKMNEIQKEQAARYYTAYFQRVIEETRELNADVLILDEFLSAYNHEFIDHNQAMDFFKNRPDKLEVVMTGREPAAELLQLADYVSEIKKIKHPYDKGIEARRGIEM